MNEPIRSLDANYYTDPEIFTIEKSGLLRNTWQFAGHVSQVHNPGDYFTFSIAGENLFCIKGKDGNLRAFYNVCQHRAHELVKDTGQLKLIVCPYHAWTYELNGDLRAGPNIAVVDGFNRCDIKLTPVRIEEFCGFIFANLDWNADKMDKWFPNVRNEISDYVPQYANLNPLSGLKYRNSVIGKFQ